MLKKRKIIRKTLKKEIKNHIYQKDEEGRIIVPITVCDDTDFLSVLSESDAPIISSDVAEYLAERTEYLPPSEAVRLQIYSNCIDAEEQKVYEKAIREHYETRYIQSRREWIRNVIVSVVLAASGLGLLFLTAFLDERFGLPVWTELADIVSWVFLWESVDVSVFGNHEVRRDCLRCLNGLEMKIEFLPKKEKK